MTPRRLIEPARLAGGAVLSSQSDERLVDLVRAGNDRAFEAIVHRYSKALLRYCRRFLPAARAEDAVQQTFLNAYRAISADDRAIDLRPWLYRIAHNTALNVLRSGANVETEPIDEQVDGVERPDQAFERREQLADVVAAVQALPPNQRDAIVLKELEGRSYDEIATQLRVTGGAVRQLLSRARTTLRAGATAVVPEWVLVRLASSGAGEPVAARIAETVAAGGGAAVLMKAGTAVVIAGALAAGAAEGPLGIAGDRHGKHVAAAQAVQPASASGRAAATLTGSGILSPIASGPSGPSGPSGSGGRRGSGQAGPGAAAGVLVDHHGGGPSGSGHGGSGTRGDDNSGSTSGDGRSGSDDSHSGSGAASDDHGGSGSDDGSRGGSASSGSGSSGSGSSGDDSESGSGSGSTGSGSSGSGSGGSDDPATTTDGPLAIPAPDHSGSNSGRGSSSGSSGSGGKSGSDSSDDPAPAGP